MFKSRYTGIVSLATLLAFSGCVSSGSFDKMLSEKNKEIDALQQQNAELKQIREAQARLNDDLVRQRNVQEQRNAILEQQGTVLRQDKLQLTQQVQSSEQLSSAMQQKVGTLEEQNAALLAASKQRQQQYDDLVKQLSNEVEKGQLQVKKYQNMLSVDLAEKVFFDSGKAALKPEGKKILKKVGDALMGYESKIIRVVGHTDNVPIAKALQKTFPTNWELSVARATTVVRFLQDVGISPMRMIASGRGEYGPVASNDTEEGKQSNRRIEILLIDQNLVNELEKSTN